MDKSIITTQEAAKGFYPTPPEAAALLVSEDDLQKCRTILEPSAGSGSLIFAVATHLWEIHGNNWGDIRRITDVDCIEIDPHLRSVLQYEWGSQRVHELWDKIPQYERRELKKYPEVFRELNPRRAVKVRIVHDDFLAFDSRKDYDLIVMNPPFSNGDAHLMKAIRLQERYGGEIRCILNAETLLNPYTNLRKALVSKLQKYNAQVTYHDGLFSGAERKTDVRCAIVKISIPAPKYESSIYDRLKKAAEAEEFQEAEVTDLSVTDFVQKIVSQFNVEVDAGITMIREYWGLKPYLLSTLNPNGYTSPMIRVVIGSPDHYNCDTVTVNGYVKMVRAKYWEALFTNKEFTGKLTSNILEKYQGMVKDMVEYDFTVFNIQQLMTEMNAEMATGIQETIVALFDRMTVKHSYYPECEKNRHYFDGWKTNKAHKIGKKVILPVNGMFGCYSWDKDELNQRKAEETISDIEKVFDYLDGNMTAPVDLHAVIDEAVKSGMVKNMPCKYFNITIYKKGTMHITFRDMGLVDKFNIYCCRHKNWLPPNYGKTAYTDMTTEEKDVVDGFHGDGKSGSGAERYAKVLAQPGYYLSEPTQSLPALMAPGV